jgi:hypothetical protein
MPEESKDSLATLKAVIEWSLRLGPTLSGIILFVFTLYTNQNSMIKHDADVDQKLTKLDTRINEESRATVERLAKADAAVEEVKHELQFYMQIQHK